MDSTTTYADGTSITLGDFPFAEIRAARALCTDGKVRAFRPTNGHGDTFFSVPGSVKVGGKTVTGFISTETRDGFSTATDDDPAVVKFTAYRYGKNGHLLPREEDHR
jgi:hypothetical protein